MSAIDLVGWLFSLIGWLFSLIGLLLSLAVALIGLLWPLLLALAILAIIAIAVLVGAARLAPIVEQILERLWLFRSALRTAISRTRHSIVELLADGLWSLGDPVRMLARGMARAGAPLRGERPEQRLFPGDPDAETAAVADRERFITELLRRYKRSPPRFEALQTPPRYETTTIEEPLDERSADAQMVQLLYQTSSPQSLLFSRAVDAVICIWRKALRAGAVAETADVELRLRPARWWERRRNGYRWVVVIYTDHFDILKTPLQELRTWIGIGVNFRPAASIGLQRGCARSESRGTVAGVIRSLSKNIDYSLTCGHVIPEACDPTHRR